MKFEKLHAMIPYVLGGKEKVLEMHPYNAITLRMPGRHSLDTTPPGGDFVVCVDDERMDWVAHQFTHVDIFKNLQARVDAGAHDMDNFMKFYLSVVQGGSPEYAPFTHHGPCVHPQTFFYAVQCLAIAEHRRYAKFENKFGGRYLPFRFGAGIVEGLWTAVDAADKQRRGRPGVEQLEKERGIPILSKELMS